MTWLLLMLGGAAGLFYGLWQRSRASRFESELKRARLDAVYETTLHADDIRRYEALVVSLKADITRLEEAALANATPDELRARLAALLRPHT
jgi:hypothetical protein